MILLLKYKIYEYQYAGYICLKLRPDIDGDGVVSDLIIIFQLSLSSDFPPTLKQVESPFMAQTILYKRESCREFEGFHLLNHNLLYNIRNLSYKAIVV